MKLIKLFISFFKIGAFSFGGGYAMLPFIKKEIIEVHSWLTMTEFLDILAIAEMTPGPIAINSATFLGYKVSGFMGSMVATIAVVLPSFIIMSLFFYFLRKFKDSPYIEWAFQGIRPVVLGLIASACIVVAKDALLGYKSIIISGIIFYLVQFKKLHPILAIVLSGAIGVLIY